MNAVCFETFEKKLAQVMVRMVEICDATDLYRRQKSTVSEKSSTRRARVHRDLLWWWLCNIKRDSSTIAKKRCVDTHNITFLCEWWSV